MSLLDDAPDLARPRLAGKVVVVVGAGKTPGETMGNGRAASVMFSRAGAEGLVLVDRDEASAQATASMCEVPTVVVEADVTADDTPARVVEAAVSSFSRIDVLHNNVGIGAGDGPVHKIDEDTYDLIMDVNLRGVLRMCKAVIPVMREQGGGSIVNISSVAAIAAAPNLTAYRMSKAAMNAMTQNIAIGNAKHGIRANVIMPGLIDTPMAVDAAARATGIDRATLAEGRASMVPMQHQGSAWDIAMAALFLASDEAKFVTGVLFPVDGGQSARVG